MAGGGGNEDMKFEGIRKYFNGYTMQGRANQSKLALSILGLTILYFKFKPAKKQ